MASRNVPINEGTLLLGAGALVLLFIVIKGGVSGAAAAAAKAAADAAAGVATGTVDVIGQGVGLPPLADITTDAHVARWIMDHPAGGRFAASQWASATAFGSALWLDVGSGTPPPASSQIAKTFPISQYVQPAADEPQDHYDAMGNFLGNW